MNYKDRWSAVIDARKAWKKAKKAQRKLRQRTNATWKQKNSWKAALAKSMRANPTKWEAILYDALTQAKIQYHAQVQIGPYIADCYIPEHKVVIEVDGKVHDSRKEYDAARDRYMWLQNYRVIRFTNSEVGKNMAACLVTIKAFIAEI